MRAEYDFSKMKLVGRGIYRERFLSGTNLVLLDSDVRKAFPDDESVNEALRVIVKAAMQLAVRSSKGSARNHSKKANGQSQVNLNSKFPGLGSHFRRALK